MFIRIDLSWATDTIHWSHSLLCSCSKATKVTQPETLSLVSTCFLYSTYWIPVFFIFFCFLNSDFLKKSKKTKKKKKIQTFLWRCGCYTQSTWPAHGPSILARDRETIGSYQRATHFCRDQTILKNDNLFYRDIEIYSIYADYLISCLFVSLVNLV